MSRGTTYCIPTIICSTSPSCNLLYICGVCTELAIDHYRFSTDIAKSLLSHSGTCGQALQRTNIVKDFPQDLANGICYLPDVWMQEVDDLPLLLKGAPKEWTQKVLNNVMAEINNSVSYVMHIPYEAVGYRLASLMCL